MQQTERKAEAKKSFKMGDMVAIQIEKPHKVSALHPKMLVGKIVTVLEQNYSESSNSIWQNLKALLLQIV